MRVIILHVSTQHQGHVTKSKSKDVKEELQMQMQRNEKIIKCANKSPNIYYTRIPTNEQTQGIAKTKPAINGLEMRKHPVHSASVRLRLLAR